MPTQSTTESTHAGRSRVRRNIGRWLAGAALLCPLFLMGLHFFHTKTLRDKAAQIQVGDSIERVTALLGDPPESWHNFSPDGSPPTRFGLSYGGPFNRFRSTLDSRVSRTFKGAPGWYHQLLGQRHWPVEVLYNEHGIVTKVRR